MKRLLLPSAVSLLCAVIPACAADTWTKLTTPHFELYTTAGEKKGREAILYFEQVRSFFLASSPSKKASDFPVRIVAFRSEKEYRPYRINDFSAAFYTHDENRDYIVMQDIAAEHYPVATHEFTHLIIQHSGLRIPVWMNEGWADLYSTLKPSGHKVIVGELIAGRVQTLLQGSWIPLTELGQVGHDSSLYNERNQAGLFYAESWAFMHMLYLGKGYSGHFAQFVASISSGKSLAETCQTVLGKPIDAVQIDLQQYLKGSRLYAAVFPIQLTKSEEEPQVSQPDLFESGIVLADLLAVGHKPAAAKAAYEQLAAQYPNRPAIYESLGYLTWKTGDPAGARAYFQRALDNGTKSPLMCYRLAALSENESKREDALKALRKALELKPDYTDARLHLATTLLEAGSYEASLTELGKIKKVDEEHASMYFSAAAFDYAHLGKDDEARKHSDLATKWAKTEEDTDRAASVARYLARQKNAPQANLFIQPGDVVQRFEGTATDLDCQGKRAVLKVSAKGQTMSFVVPDPERLVVKHEGAATADFTCGPQKPFRVVVIYAKPVDTKTDGDGIVRSLEF